MPLSGSTNMPCVGGLPFWGQPGPQNLLQYMHLRVVVLELFCHCSPSCSVFSYSSPPTLLSSLSFFSFSPVRLEGSSGVIVDHFGTKNYVDDLRCLFFLESDRYGHFDFLTLHRLYLKKDGKRGRDGRGEREREGGEEGGGKMNVLISHNYLYYSFACTQCLTSLCVSPQTHCLYSAEI